MGRFCSAATHTKPHSLCPRPRTHHRVRGHTLRTLHARDGNRATATAAEHAISFHRRATHCAFSSATHKQAPERRQQCPLRCWQVPAQSCQRCWRRAVRCSMPRRPVSTAAPLCCCVSSLERWFASSHAWHSASCSFDAIERWQTVSAYCDAWMRSALVSMPHSERSQSAPLLVVCLAQTSRRSTATLSSAISVRCFKIWTNCTTGACHRR